MFAALIAPLLHLLFPGAAAWVTQLLATGVPAVVALVQDLAEQDGRTGAEKRALAIEETGKLLDEAMDGIPAWSALTEEQRDRILGGLVELAYFINATGTPKKTKRSVAQALRAIRNR